MRRALPVAVLLAPLLVLPAPASARSTTVRLAPGVTLTTSSFGMRAGGAVLPERVRTVAVSLSARTSLVAAAPGRDVLGAPRATVLSLARQERAVAGVNGDFFYVADPAAVPRGGITHDGHLLKSALGRQQAALFVTAAGVAAIGDPGFTGSVSTDDGHRFAIRSANSLENARNGALTLTDAALLSHGGMPRCAQARLAPVAGGWQVTSVTAAITTYRRVPAPTRALVTCSAAGRSWLLAHVRPGHVVQVGAGYAVPRIRTLLSGGRVLIRQGRRYDDRGGLLGYGDRRKPETFACVLPGGRRVLLGVVDGDRPGAAGMTYRELTGYLLQRGCESAMTLDGSGSSTLVARRPGAGLALENRPTAPGGPRRVVDGLFVVYR